MYKRLAALKEKEEGFTLIELMVVVLIIAILIAIAIPTFLGARARAQDRAVQSNLRNALTAEKTHYTDTEEFTNVVNTLEAIEPSIGWQAGAPNGANIQDQLQVLVNGTQEVCLNVTSASGRLFGMKEIATGNDAGTYYFTDAHVDCSAAGRQGGVTTGF